MIKHHLVMLLTVLTIVSGLVAASTIVKQQQSLAQTTEPKSTIVNSKFLTIKDPRFRDEGFGSSSITGTIFNNSTSQISLAQVYAVLYDKDNKLITVESGIVDVSTLKPHDNSAFKVSLFGLSSAGTIDHYTLMPGGTPT